MLQDIGSRSPKRGESATLHRLRTHRKRRVTFVFRLNGIESLAAVYGQEAAYEATSVVKRALNKRATSHGQASSLAEGVVTLALWDLPMLESGPIDEACEHFIADFASSIALRTIPARTEMVHVCLSGAYSIADEGKSLRGAPQMAEDLLLASTVNTAGLSAPYGSKPWAANYREDMRIAAALLDDVAADRIQYAWQPVLCGLPHESVAYYECLLRITRDGTQMSTGDAVGALERVGLARVLDQHVVAHVIDELVASPGVCLGVNISAQSTQVDEWWRRNLEVLSKRRDVAERLIIEITETSALVDTARAAAFVAHMRELGVRIAIDDFGVDHSSIRRLFAWQPDIVKIDRFFLSQAVESAKGATAFRHLVGLASAVAPIVVSEGVETQAERQMAAESGAGWQQGYLYGMPTPFRAWRHPAQETSLPA